MLSQHLNYFGISSLNTSRAGFIFYFLFVGEGVTCSEPIEVLLPGIGTVVLQEMNPDYSDIHTFICRVQISKHL